MAYPGRSFRAAGFWLLAAVVFSSSNALANPQWREVRSPHFAVITDADAKEGIDIVSRLERMRAVFSALMTKPNVNDPAPLSIVALHDTAELRDILRPAGGESLHSGLFKSDIDESFIVVDLRTADRWHALQHEYAHELLHANTGVNTPAWFEEGFAEYFSTLTAGKQSAKVGLVPIRDLSFLREHGRLMHLQELFQVEPGSSVYQQNGELQSIFYAESWLLVHYLFDHGLTAKAAGFFTAISNSHDYRRAVSDTFARSIEDLEENILSYGKGQQFRYFSLPYREEPVASNTTSRVLEKDEAAAIEANVRWHFVQDPDTAMVEYGRVLDANPTMELALRGMASVRIARGELAEAAELLHKALAIDPSDTIAHYLLAMVGLRSAGSGREGIREAVREANRCIAFNPSFAGCYAILSVAYRAAGDRGQQALALNKALSLSPRSERYLNDLENSLKLIAGPDTDQP